VSYAPSKAIGRVNQLDSALHIGIYEVAGLGQFICLVHLQPEGVYRLAEEAPIIKEAIAGHGGMEQFRVYLVRMFRKWIKDNYANDNPDESLQRLVDSFSIAELRN